MNINNDLKKYNYYNDMLSQLSIMSEKDQKLLKYKVKKYENRLQKGGNNINKSKNTANFREIESIINNTNNMIRNNKLMKSGNKHMKGGDNPKMIDVNDSLNQLMEFVKKTDNDEIKDIGDGLTNVISMFAKSSSFLENVKNVIYNINVMKNSITSGMDEKQKEYAKLDENYEILSQKVKEGENISSGLQNELEETKKKLNEAMEAYKKLEEIKEIITELGRISNILGEKMNSVEDNDDFKKILTGDEIKEKVQSPEIESAESVGREIGKRSNDKKDMGKELFDIMKGGNKDGEQIPAPEVPPITPAPVVPTTAVPTTAVPAVPTTVVPTTTVPTITPPAAAGAGGSEPGTSESTGNTIYLDDNTSLDEIIEKIDKMDLENTVFNNWLSYYKFNIGKDIVRIYYGDLLSKIEKMKERGEYYYFKKKYIDMYERGLYDKIRMKITEFSLPESIKKIIRFFLPELREKRLIYIDEDGSYFPKHIDNIYYLITIIVKSINEKFGEILEQMEKQWKNEDETAKNKILHELHIDFDKYSKQVEELKEYANEIYIYVKKTINDNKKKLYIEYIMDYDDRVPIVDENFAPEDEWDVEEEEYRENLRLTADIDKANFNGLIKLFIDVKEKYMKFMEHYDIFIELKKRYNYLKRSKLLKSRINMRNKK